MRLPVVTVVLLASCALAAPSATHILHEKRNGEPFAWKRHSRATAEHVLPMRIGLKQRNLERMEEHVMDVADPSSPNFGKHWTAEQVANAFAPLKETSDRTIDWLVSSGIDKGRLKHSKGRNWIEFDVSVDEAERLLDTEYHFYQHENGGFRVACDSYGIPSHVRDHIDFVMPTIQLDGLYPVKNLAPAHMTEAFAFTGLTGLSNCSKLITIECLRALYNFPAGQYNHSGNELGIPEWADYLYLPDLPTYFQNYTKPEIPSDTVPEFISIDGGKASNLTQAQEGNVIESALDFQTSYSIIWPQQIRHYQVGDGINVDSVGTFNIFLDALDESYCTYLGGDEIYIDPAYPDPNLNGYTGPLQCGGAPKSNVYSVSYGQIEGALPVFYQERQCHEWAKLALQGASVIYASGDSGVANRYNAGYNNTCLNAKYGYVDINGTKFSPSFPVNCPYITAVGATTLKGTNITSGEEAVAQINPAEPLNYFYSGAGFSNVFAMPSYQSKAVTHYLKTYAPNYGPGIYNNSGNSRAYPDVSAIGQHVATVWLGKTYGVGGTSASAPIFASLITLLNEERLQHGKKPMGFLNPTLYKHPEMFNDIVDGRSEGCGTKGFAAVPGWDPSTGLGTPKYEVMRRVFLSLP